MRLRWDMLFVEILIDHQLCKNCGICAEICPRNAIKINSNSFLIENERCSGCKLCEYLCPDFAIEVTKVENK